MRDNEGLRTRGGAGRGRGEAGEEQARANRGAAQGGKAVWLSCAVTEQHEGKIKNKVGRYKRTQSHEVALGTTVC
jgi:hypothetical protein